MFCFSFSHDIFIITASKDVVKLTALIYKRTQEIFKLNKSE